MAFPAVVTTAETAVTTAGTSHQVTLPSGVVAGDLVLIVTARGVAVATFNSLAGWTEVVDDGAANGVTVWARTADGGEGSTVTFTSSANTRSASIAYRISGAKAVGSQVPEISTVATGSSTTPNATTCTPTGGAKDYLWVSLFSRSGEEADDDTWVSAAPANFGGLLQKACGTAGVNLGGMIAAATYQNNAASLDAGSFTCATGGWRAYTVAVHPPTDTPLTPGTLSLTTTRYTPTVTVSDNAVVTPGVLSIVTAGFAPAVTASDNTVVTPGVLSLTTTGYAPTVTVSGGGKGCPASFGCIWG